MVILNGVTIFFYIFIKKYKMSKPLRLNSEKKIDNKYFDVRIGTVNRLNPIAIYVEGRTFIKPLEERDDYLTDVSTMRYSLKKSVIKELNQSELFDRRFIIDFDIASSCIKYDKNSFLFFQITMKQKNNPPIKINDLKTASEDMITNIVNGLTETIRNCDFTLKKEKR